ncbi:MAG: hypothetical protein ACREI9_08055 [Nitrospiraceae bacterium]
MDAIVADILEKPDRWIGGTLVDYGLVNPKWSAKLKADMVAEDDYPRRARITQIQLEDGKYFCVIGSAVDGLENFACMEDVGVLKVTEAPLFVGRGAGEIAFKGRKDGTRTCWHEWHLIPKNGGIQ